MEKSFTVGFAQANHNFGTPAENVFIPESVQHTMDGCNFCSEASVLNDYGFNVSEEQLQQEATEQGWYSAGGGTPMDCMGKHIDGRGVPVSMTEGNGVDNLISELSQGHRVIVAIDSGELWEPSFAEALEDRICGGIPDHAVIVDGVSLSDNLVTITDSGTGNFRTQYPLNDFMDAWNDSNCTMVATQISPEEYMAGGEMMA
jgi:hypothetical protein